MHPSEYFHMYLLLQFPFRLWNRPDLCCVSTFCPHIYPSVGVFYVLLREHWRVERKREKKKNTRWTSLEKGPFSNAHSALLCVSLQIAGSQAGCVKALNLQCAAHRISQPTALTLTRTPLLSKRILILKCFFWDNRPERMYVPDSRLCLSLYCIAETWALTLLKNQTVRLWC